MPNSYFEAVVFAGRYLSGNRGGCRSILDGDHADRGDRRAARKAQRQARKAARRR